MDAHDVGASSGMSFDWKPKEGGDPAKSFQLLARLVVAAHQDDGSPSRLGGAQEVLDAGIPPDGIAYEEGIDLAGLDRSRNFGGSVRARPIRRNRLQQLLDDPRLVPDPAVSEDLCANTRFERLLNSLHPGLSRAVRMDFRNEGWLPRFQVLQERVPCEPRSDEDERFADFRGAKLREDLVKVDGTGVSRREHLAVPGRANRRQFTNSVLPELGEKRFFVIQRKERDQGFLRRGDGLVDPSQLMRLPRLDDGEDVVHHDVQRVMSPQVLRSLDDDAGDPQPVRERLEFDALHPDGEGDADLLAPLRPDLVGFHFLAAVG